MVTSDVCLDELPLLYILGVMLATSLLLAGQLLSSFSLDKLCEARGDHCGAQKDLRKPGPQHLCEYPN